MIVTNALFGIVLIPSIAVWYFTSGWLKDDPQRLRVGLPMIAAGVFALVVDVLLRRFIARTGGRAGEFEAGAMSDGMMGAEAGASVYGIPAWGLGGFIAFVGAVLAVAG